MEIAQSSTKSEYTSLLYILQEVIYIINLLYEFKYQGTNISNTIPKIHYKVFKDNGGGLEIVSIYKY